MSTRRRPDTLKVGLFEESLFLKCIWILWFWSWVCISILTYWILQRIGSFRMPLFSLTRSSYREYQLFWGLSLLNFKFSGTYKVFHCPFFLSHLLFLFHFLLSYPFPIVSLQFTFPLISTSAFYGSWLHFQRCVNKQLAWSS